MKKFIVLEGDVVVREYTGMTPPPGLEDGQTVEEVGIASDLLGKYRKDGEYKPLPPSPSSAHVFSLELEGWVDPRPPDEQTSAQWAKVRQQRNQLLSASDFSQLPDSPKNKQAWAKYRQDLRDVTKQADPFNVIWPTTPSE